MRARAQSAPMNIRRVDTCGLQLVHVCSPEVEVRTPARLASEPAIDRAARVPGRDERVDDFLAHLTAADAQRRADRDHEVVRSRTERIRERTHRRGRYPMHRAAPSRMDGGNRSIAPIRYQ